MGVRCEKCQTYYEGNFCNNCGEKTPEEEKIPFIGEHRDKGVYQVTFAPVENEFEDMDQVYSAARHSAWNEDSEFEEYDVKKIRSTVTRETHPYICNNCRQYVTDTLNGRCNSCGADEWVERTDETEDLEQAPNKKIE